MLAEFRSRSVTGQAERLLLDATLERFKARCATCIWRDDKAHVTEACEDDAAHLVTHGATGPAIEPDMATNAGIHERLAAEGLRPAEPAVGSAHVDAARARMSGPAWAQRHQVRAGVEGTLSQGVRAFGMRRSRTIGLARAGLQQVCIAAVMNRSRIVGRIDGRPRTETRVTHFAARTSAA